MSRAGSHEALLEAAAAGDEVRVRALLEQRPEWVNESSRAGKTALHWAAERDDVRMVELLLRRGADPGLRTDWGMTPLDWAATLGRQNAARMLIDRQTSAALTLFSAAGLGMVDEAVRFFGPDGRVRTHAGRSRPGTPLDPSEWPSTSAFARGDVVSDAFYVAARNGHIDMTAFLLQRGADVDAEGYFGGTGLHWAAVEGHQDMVAWLAERGASVHRRDVKFGATPADWANEGGNEDIEAFLRSRMTGPQG